MQTFDHVIVGTGQATGTLLGRLIPTGERIAVIEGARVGGTCVNTGCTPTKTLVASARAIHQARQGDTFGFRAGPVEVDYDRVRERMNAVRGAARQGLTDWLEETDTVTLIRGWAAFEQRREAAADQAGAPEGHVLRVGDERLQGRRTYLNVGTRAVVPPIEGLASVPWLDHDRVLDLEAQPEHLVIVGGGYVGVELAQVYRRFGAEVTLLQRAERLMPREDDDVTEAIRTLLEREGVRVRTGVDVRRVGPSADGVRVEAACGEEMLGIEGSHLLIAVGQRPNTERLNLGAVGIETDERGYIRVDEVCRTTAEGVFAVGDVNGEGAFTHTAVNDAEIVLDHLFGGPRTLATRIPIYALFTDPPLGRVGLTEHEAVASGRRVLKGTRPMSRISRAKERGETHGFAKLLVDADTDAILGAAILGPGGDEIINMFAAIMHSGIPCHRYRQVVLVHPTVSELMPFVLDELEEVTL